MDIETSYKTLALNPGSPYKEIKLAYIAKVKQYHPDRFTAESINHHLAENKLKEVNLAFETLMQHFKAYAPDTEEQPDTKATVEKKNVPPPPVHRVPQRMVDSENHPNSLKKARIMAKKIACDDAEISQLFSASNTQYRHAQHRATTSLTLRMDEINRTENEIIRHQELLDNKYFKKGIFDISKEHKFTWKELKKRLSFTGDR